MSESDQGMKALLALLKHIKEESEEGCDFIMLSHIRSELLKQFDEKVVKPYYSQPGVNESLDKVRSRAIQELMREAIQKEKKE